MRTVIQHLAAPVQLQALVPPMGARGWGRVVTIGSVQQVRPHPQMLIYAGTKAAQLMGVSRRTLHRKIAQWPELDVTDR